MQALRSVFFRTSAQQGAAAQTAAASQPVELSANQLALVAGGLPRVSGQSATAASGAEAPLPRVS
jgi:hypothetical protein